MMLHGVAVLRLQPRAQWLEALQQSVSQQLELLRPRDISQVGLRADTGSQGRG
jgi:hypothetical protein